MAKESKTVVIVGGGIIGLCSAYYAMREGFSVTVIDRGKETSPSCSTGNAGMVVPSHFVPLAAPGMVSMGLKMMFNPRSPFRIKPRASLELVSWMWKFLRSSTRSHVARAAPILSAMSLGSRQAYEELADEIEFGLQKRGLLMLCKTGKMLEHESVMAEEAGKYGVEARVLSSQGAAELDPAIRMDIRGAIYFPQDCQLTPQRLLAGLREKLGEGGTRFHYESEVTGWKRNEKRIHAAVTSKGEVEGDEFVIAGGAWSPAVVKDLGIQLPMQAGKGYSVTLENPLAKPEICSLLMEARVAITPMGNALRVGGTMELAGIDDSIREKRLRGIFESVPEYYPELREQNFESNPVWHGFRPCSPDGMPYIGRVETCPNLVCATGHSMLGLSLGPITGKLVASVLCGREPEVDLAMLRPGRFQ